MSVFINCDENKPFFSRDTQTFIKNSLRQYPRGDVVVYHPQVPNNFNVNEYLNTVFPETENGAPSEPTIMILKPSNKSKKCKRRKMLRQLAKGQPKINIHF